MRGRDASRVRCGHTPCEAVRTEDGQAFYARCLVCGKIGPPRPGPEAARWALLPDPEKVRDEDEGSAR